MISLTEISVSLTSVNFEIGLAITTNNSDQISGLFRQEASRAISINNNQQNLNLSANNSSNSADGNQQYGLFRQNGNQPLPNQNTNVFNISNFMNNVFDGSETDSSSKKRVPSVTYSLQANHK